MIRQAFLGHSAISGRDQAFSPNEPKQKTQRAVAAPKMPEVHEERVSSFVLGMLAVEHVNEFRMQGTHS